jgi:hypothetical protein
MYATKFAMYQKIAMLWVIKFYSNRLHIQNTSEQPSTNLLKVAKLGKTMALRQRQ